MPKGSTPPIKNRDLLPHFRAERAEHAEKEAFHHEQVVKLDAVIAALEALPASGAKRGPHKIAKSSRAPVTTARPEKPASHGTFYGLGLGEAGAKFLDMSGRNPQTVKEIWAGLQAAGYTIAAKDPIATLSWQLRKRESKGKDVLLIGDGKWALAEWYSAEKVAEILATRGKQPWRNRQDHIDRTLEGMKQAAEERGIRLGAKRLMTMETLGKAEALLNAGASGPEVAEKLGLSVSTIYTWFTVERGDGRKIIRRKRPDSDYPPRPEKLDASGAETGQALLGFSDDEMKERGIIPLHAHVVRG